jgi:hypothetical protein
MSTIQSGLLTRPVHCRATAIQNIELHGWVRLLNLRKVHKWPHVWQHCYWCLSCTEAAQPSSCRLSVLSLVCGCIPLRHVGVHVQAGPQADQLFATLTGMLSAGDPVRRISAYDCEFTGKVGAAALPRRTAAAEPWFWDGALPGAMPWVLRLFMNGKNGMADHQYAHTSS